MAPLFPRCDYQHWLIVIETVGGIEDCGIRVGERRERKPWSGRNSWAYSTQTIEVMVMVHGDDKGLVLPPKVASVQVIMILVPYKDVDTQGIFDAVSKTVNALSEAGVHVESDFRDNYSPG
ncbi:hypothetical protein RJT34_03440 [Clitoria ternatea]|uniref:Uncharacterized protein n=1 Tax=Clitoria ternatea TaxID=43366 RepID=A0AAN9KM68_CLITE